MGGSGEHMRDEIGSGVRQRWAERACLPARCGTAAHTSTRRRRRLGRGAPSYPGHGAGCQLTGGREACSCLSRGAAPLRLAAAGGGHNQSIKRLAATFCGAACAAAQPHLRKPSRVVVRLLSQQPPSLPTHSTCAGFCLAAGHKGAARLLSALPAARTGAGGRGREVCDGLARTDTARIRALRFPRPTHGPVSHAAPRGRRPGITRARTAL